MWLGQLNMCGLDTELFCNNFSLKIFETHTYSSEILEQAELK